MKTKILILNFVNTVLIICTSFLIGKYLKGTTFYITLAAFVLTHVIATLVLHYTIKLYKIAMIWDPQIIYFPSDFNFPNEIDFTNSEKLREFLIQEFKSKGKCVDSDGVSIEYYNSLDEFVEAFNDECISDQAVITTIRKGEIPQLWVTRA